RSACLTPAMALVALVGACSDKDADTTATEERKSNVHGIDLANFDTSVKACDDFYQYSNGTWLENNPIPAAYQRWTMFNEVNDRNEATVKDILETAAANDAAEPGSNAQKIGDFFASAMDEAATEAAGAQPLDGDMARIDAIASVDDLAKFITAYQAEGFNLLFDVSVFEDLKDSTRYLVYLSQGGLGMPDRDYYLKDDDDSRNLREKYVAHVANMLTLLGDSRERAAENAKTIMAIETRLAEKSLTRVERRDPESQYHLTTPEAATKEMTPHFSWRAFLDGLGLEGLAEFSIATKPFFNEVDQLLLEYSVDDWKTYLRWHMVSAVAPYLSSAFVDENFDFYSKTLGGQQELLPRWKRALRTTNMVLGEALGQLYVETAFPPATKARAMEMIENLRAATRMRIEKLDWMGEETKKRALRKLATFTPKIGYPDVWRDYSAYDVERGLYVDNVRRGIAFETRRQLNKIGQPIDKHEWGMYPHMVNAYYNPVKNEIVFPAGIMQPPFFDGEIDDAVNYGAMGGVIGHEFLHGFDDKGSKFDGDGNLRNWWTDEDRRRFEERTDKLVAQFDGYVAIDDLHVNGKLTLGENIGDLGGLTMAYAALRMAREGKADPMIDGLTQNQRFFLAWSQAWRANYRDEAIRLRVKTDPHSPPRFRGNGPLSNMEAFHEAFNCKPGDKMVRNEDDRVKIW
ncbi:MAG: M13 family metallopeptidase, partial [Sphingomonadales bacterium]